MDVVKNHPGQISIRTRNGNRAILSADSFAHDFVSVCKSNDDLVYAKMYQKILIYDNSNETIRLNRPSNNFVNGRNNKEKISTQY